MAAKKYSVLKVLQTMSNCQYCYWKDNGVVLTNTLK